MNSISTQEIKSIQTVPNSKFSKEHILELKTPKKYYYLQFPNETILNQWISKLQEIVKI